MDKPKIKYPCQWSYRVIGMCEDDMRQSIAEVMQDRKHSLTTANTSKKGAYVSLNIDVMVADENDRNEIYQALTKCKSVKMVL